MPAEEAARRSSPPTEEDLGHVGTAHPPVCPATRPERGGWTGEEQVVVPCEQRAGGCDPGELAERGSGMFVPTLAAPRERQWRRAATVLSGGALLAVAVCGLLSENSVRSGLLAYGGYSYGTTYAPAYSPWAPAPAYMPAQYAQPAQGYGQMLAPAPLPAEGSYQVGNPACPFIASPQSPPAPHRHLHLTPPATDISHTLSIMLRTTHTPSHTANETRGSSSLLLCSRYRS